ncbi:MAG TPA: 50S ribosomal protein L9 [Verrucomicrobiota bacterium]|jgi:large subunit ribosomal protein L9|nr:50S ribosomal protein L9 [Verrucomicrobiota bacterium]
MSKVDVILVRSVSDLGAEGDQVKVAAGYARNYLVPQGYAIPVTMANKRHLEALKERRIAREARELESMTELGAMLSKLVLDVAVKTNEDHTKMYGSVTSSTIVDELKARYEIALDRHKVEIEKPIRSLGPHEVTVKLHAKVVVTLQVNVKSSNPVVAGTAAN